MRLVHLDEVIFENQRFFFGARDDGFEVGNQLHHLARERRMAAIFGEIRAHAIFQIARLADINHFARAVFVQIHAGRIGQGGEFFD